LLSPPHTVIDSGSMTHDEQAINKNNAIQINTILVIVFPPRLYIADISILGGKSGIFSV